MMPMNKTIEQQKLQRILSWRKFESSGSYPESSMPQNDLDLVTSAGKESTFNFKHLEAQSGN
jgi:hypothetical protein